MYMLVVLVLFGLIVGAIASSKGRRFFPWFIYGALLFIIAFIHVLCIQGKKEKQCPECKSNIDREALVCKFCQHKFTKEEMQEVEATIEGENKHNNKMFIVLMVLLVILWFLFRNAFLGHF